MNVELAAICLILATCAILIAMVIGAAVQDWRRERDRRVVDLQGTLEPYEVTKVVDLRDPEPYTAEDRALLDRMLSARD